MSGRSTQYSVMLEAFNRVSPPVMLTTKENELEAALIMYWLIGAKQSLISPNPTVFQKSSSPRTSHLSADRLVLDTRR